MARTASIPFMTYATLEEAQANRPPKQLKKDGSDAIPLNLYSVALPGADTVYVWSRSPVIAIGQVAQHLHHGECILAEKPDRQPVPPAVRAKRAFAKLDDASRAALLAELMGTKPTNGDSAPAPQESQPMETAGHGKGGRRGR